jgi:hypothetical protein
MVPGSKGSFVATHWQGIGLQVSATSDCLMTGNGWLLYRV